LPYNFLIDSIEISPINLSHPNVGLGYKFKEDGKTLVFLTDNELRYRHRDGRSFDEYAEFAKDADVFIHDAEFTPEEYKITKSWGHSTYHDALLLALDAQVRRFGLFHHNQNRNDTDQDEIVQKCREILEEKNSGIDCSALTQETELLL
jgi:ribonuclease BN (tRNA processing enzyme)